MNNESHLLFYAKDSYLFEFAANKLALRTAHEKIDQATSTTFSVIIRGDLGHEPWRLSLVRLQCLISVS